MAPRMLLAGKVAVITGAASRIGKAIAAMFVQHGAKVILADVDYNSCLTIAAVLNNSVNAPVLVAHAMFCDVSDPSNILQVIQEAKKIFSQDLDIFYNNAGINDDVSPIDIDIFKRTMAVNVESVLAIIKYAGDVMHNGGCILCTGSTLGLVSEAVPSAYSISKTALIGVVRGAAAELATRGVRVNAISSHLVPSFNKRVLHQVFPHASPQQLDDMIKNCMTNAVTEEDVASAAVHLASDAGKSLNGQNLVLNGKFSL